jgi:hypothetical protein
MTSKEKEKLEAGAVTVEKKPEKKEPEYRVIRFRSDMRGIRYTCLPQRKKEYFKPGTGERIRETTEGKYIFTDAKGFIAPTDDPDILRWYLKYPTYQYEITCLWGDKEPSRPFGEALRPEERKRIEELIAWKEAGN